MSPEQVIATVWRRKLSFVLTLIVCVGATVAATLSLPEKYSATATMFVGERSQDSEALLFDTNAGEQLARTYTALASNPNIANLVQMRLNGRQTSEQVLDKVSFAPVERTQLLEITATEESPEAARRLANIYAGTFVMEITGQFNRGAAPTRIALNQPAPLPTSSSAPNIPLYLGFGGLLSLLLAVGATLLRERLDDSLHLTPETGHLLDQPILLRLPKLSRLSPSARSGVHDAVRLLKTNIDFASENRAQAIAITSSSAVQGKSTMAAQLALTAAMDGERTVLIEADLRRPGLLGTEVGAGMERSKAGLSNFLAGMVTSDTVIEPHPEHPNLWIVWAGPLPPNPGVLLGSTRFGALVAALRPRFDRIIVDTPPLSIGSDASVTVAELDGTLLVVDQRASSLSDVRTGLLQLERASAAVLGIVLNRAISSRELGAYGYYGAPDWSDADGSNPDDDRADPSARPARTRA